MAEALYRKYRPQIFEDVVGQEHIERTIKNAIGQDKVSHAYLFTGPRGTGKTTTARLLAKALLCESGPTPEPDGTCAGCRAIADGSHPDVYELDAASRTGVENVREEIIGRVQFAPTQGRYKVYIIDEVHMLSTAAFNALLKTLEEPPSHVVFILCTTDPQKVPETIHSRCQRFDFRRLSTESIVSRLGAICVAEDVGFEGEALDLIALRAEGGMRDALTSLEQLITFGEGKVVLKDAERLLGSLDSNDMAAIVSSIGKRDIATCFKWTADYIETGADLAQFVRDLSEHIRNMYVLSLSDSDTVLEVNEVIRRELAEELQYFGQDRLMRMLGILGELSSELRTSTNPRLSFEIALTRMVRPDSDLTLEALAERIEALESGYSATARVPLQPVPDRGSDGSAQTSPTASAASAAYPRPTQSPPLQPSDPANDADARAAEAATARHEQHPGQSASGPASSDAADAVASGHSMQRADLSGLSNPAALQRTWQAALQAIKKDKAAYGVLFMNTKASYEEGSQELVIEFPPENTFAYSTVQKPEVLSVVTKALSQAAGGTVAFRYTQMGQASLSEAIPPVQKDKPVGVSDRASNQQQASPSGGFPGSPVSETIPVDAYDGYVPYDDEPYDAVPSAGPESDIGEDALKSMLTQEYGEGIVFDIVDEG